MKKKLYLNFTSLTLFQLTNYLFPLIILPYISRILGPNNYGVASFAITVVFYFITVIDYGFNYHSTREIAKIENKDSIRFIFSITIWSKIYLLIPILLLFMVSIIFIPLLRQNALILFIVFVGSLGYSFFPTWYYQGIQKMQLLLIYSIPLKLVSILLIFLLVTKESDLLVYLIILSSIQILTSLFSLINLLQKDRNLLCYPDNKNILNYLRKGISLLKSNYLIMTHFNLGVVVLGFLSGPTSVGIFIAANKIRLALQNIVSIAGQTVFPHFSIVFNKSFEAGNAILKKYTLLLTMIVVPVCIGTIVGSEEIVNLILGNQFRDSSILLKILACVPIFALLTNIFGVQFLIGRLQEKRFNRIMFRAVVLQLILLILFIPFFKEIGASIVILAVEIFVAISLIYNYSTTKN